MEIAPKISFEAITRIYLLFIAVCAVWGILLIGSLALLVAGIVNFRRRRKKIMLLVTKDASI